MAKRKPSVKIGEGGAENRLARKRWTFETIQEEAFKYKTRKEFKKNSKAYDAAVRHGILDEVCAHMPKRVDQSGTNSPRFKWTLEMLQEEALKYKTRTEFQKNSGGAYIAAIRRDLLDEVCSCMDSPKRVPWTHEELETEGIKYKTRTEFAQKQYGAYQSAIKMGILDKACSHMIVLGGESLSEQDLFKFIKSKYPKTTKLRDRKVNIPNKPHIKGFDVDMYIPELRKGIEFDGKYWHSIPGLKRSRQCWPEEDVENYHRLKDEHFRSKGIELLHINEKDWLKDQQKCIEKCLEFLGNGDSNGKT